tara:strand:+ start:3155 stop:3337 length:183 start_codon:yes stop_codon:yes gene_type:complete
MFDQRTWLVSAGTNFLGYEYAVDESQANSKTIARFGAPGAWDVDHYTITLIEWIEDQSQI